jgi:hypothetical protein
VCRSWGRWSARCATGIAALVAVLRGGANCIPHELANGRLLNIFGDS